MKLIKGPCKLTLATGDTVNTETGVMDLSEIESKKVGDTFSFHNQTFKLLKPRFIDIFRSIRRGPQIITLKDASVICGLTGLESGDNVVEAGSGSGALTLYLANHVRPDGKVYSYEMREDFFKLTQFNLKTAELDKFVKQKSQNIYEGIDEKNVDLVALDVPEPWQVVGHAREALVPGGFFVSYIPTANQLIQLSAADWTGFFGAFALESNLRFMNINPQAVRPATKGLTHTGYLFFARKD